ncbi:Cobyric acid synthase [Streptomyces alboniger]
MLHGLTGRRTYGVLPFQHGLGIDEEDGLRVSLRGAVRESVVAPPVGDDVLRVAVCAVPLMSNFTDVDALAAEPGVVVRFVDRAEELVDADLVVVPGTRGTVRALRWLRERGLADALARRAAEGRPVLGICGGFQVLGEHIEDDVESREGSVAGLGLLPVRVRFAREKTLARPVGEALGEPVEGYEIHHGVAEVAGGEAFLDGCRVGEMWGTHWHGSLESDGFRRRFLAGWRGRPAPLRPRARTSFAALREEQLDLLGDLIEEHADTDALLSLIEKGAPAGLPFIAPGAPVTGGPGTRPRPPRPLPERSFECHHAPRHQGGPVSTPYPFTALVGQDDLRLALLLNAVSPAVGGVLVRGEKGTAKSTAVRALSALLPEVPVVAGCRFSLRPGRRRPELPRRPARGGRRAARPARMVELPVGASEDRLVGALDIERALAEGVKAFEPGLLADAHRGILYVDEVNLLHDHLVDLLLDAAAMGASYVEREGVSVRHAARFLLVGTMNPEEGELRPQLLDRFGLTVEVAASRETDQRVEVVRRRLAHDDDPEAFAGRWADEEAALRDRVVAARALLPQVVLGDGALRQIAATCAAFEVDGMRADIVMARTATALAAWAGRTDVRSEDVRQAALLALPHRRRRNPFDAPGLDEDKLDETLDEAREDDAPEPPGSPEPPEGDDDPDGGPGGGGGQPPADGGPDSPGLPPQQSRDQAEDRNQGEGAGQEDAPAPQAPAAGGPGEQGAVSAAEPFRTRMLSVPGIGEGAAGRRSRARTEHGRTTGSRRPRGALTKLHLAATVQAAAPHQRARGRSGTGLVVRRDDLRQATREGREGNLVLFVVDASGSMAARQRMSAVKGAVLSLLLDAYQRRDKVGLVTFRGSAAEVALPPTSSVDAAAARLETLPTGGRTPLAAGLLRAHDVLRVERLRDAARRPLLVVVTDGRATGGVEPVAQAGRAARLFAADGVASVVVDCESGYVRLGLAGQLAGELGGTAVTLDELRADSIAGLVKDVQGHGNHSRKAA